MRASWHLLAPRVGPRARRRGAEACAVLDPAEEVALAEAGLRADARAWPPF